ATRVEQAIVRPAGGIGAVYCSFLKKLETRLRTRELAAMEISQDTTKRAPPPVVTPTPVPVGQSPPPIATRPQPAPSSGISFSAVNLADAETRVHEARRRQNRSAVEIHKKFSLAAACIVFALVGAPIALRFPRGGVGLVIGASFVVFATYYVGLIGG